MFIAADRVLTSLHPIPAELIRHQLRQPEAVPPILHLHRAGAAALIPHHQAEVEDVAAADHSAAAVAAVADAQAADEDKHC